MTAASPALWEDGEGEQEVREVEAGAVESVRVVRPVASRPLVLIDVWPVARSIRPLPPAGFCCQPGTLRWMTAAPSGDDRLAGRTIGTVPLPMA